MTEWFINSFKEPVQGWLPALVHLVRCPMDAALKDILEKVLPSTCCSGFQLLLRPSALLFLGCKIGVLGDGGMFHCVWTHTVTQNRGERCWRRTAQSVLYLPCPQSTQEALKPNARISRGTGEQYLFLLIIVEYPRNDLLEFLFVCMTQDGHCC